MASRKSSAKESGEEVLTVSRLFYGACTIIIVLGGVTWNLFTSNHADEITNNSRVNQAQWEKLREQGREIESLTAQHREIMVLLGQLRKDSDDNEQRIREFFEKGRR